MAWGGLRGSTFREGAPAQGPGVGAEIADAGGVWGGRAPHYDPGSPLTLTWPYMAFIAPLFPGALKRAT